jgi:hypothetical protein
MWARGDVVVRREIFHGLPWAALPVRVVEDSGELLAVYLQEGSPLGFAPHPDAIHPWAGKEAWRGHGTLMLQRPGDAYGIFVFWRGPARAFAGWYVNLQQPYARTPIGFDTYDHELDLWLPAGGGIEWKDEAMLEQRVREGRFTPAEAKAIRADGARVAAELEAGRRWWSDGWAAWEPDPEWEPAPLPDGWETA